ncbi:hypothetical protein JCM19992_34420 [Thermostilla marina]
MPSPEKSEQTHESGRTVRRRRRTFQEWYREVENDAVWSLVFGILSLLCFFTVWLIPLPIAGLALGIRARRKIRKAPDVRIGDAYAKAGIWMSLVFGLVGSSWVIYDYLANAPPGYELINFAELQPAPDDPYQRIPEKAKQLGDENKKVFVWGYMVPTDRRTRIKNFILVGSISHCKFCQQGLKPTQMIEVELMHDLELDYSTQKIGVGGKFYVHPEPTESQFGGVAYKIEADVVR